MKNIIFSFLLIWHHNVFSQLPQCDIFKMDMRMLGGSYSFGSPTLISSFNVGGYNNQPYFTSNNQLLISSDAAERGFTDIVAIDLLNKTYLFLTQTKELSEFSPQMKPDRTNITCVRQSGKDQILWQYPENLSSFGSNLFAGLSDFGYYLWLNSDEIVAFRVTEPHSLYHINLVTSEKTLIKENIGRSIKKDRENNVYFIHKVSERKWQLVTFNPSSKIQNNLIDIDSEDIEVMQDGTILKSNGSRIYILKPNTKNWEELINLGIYGIENITRLTYRNNYLIFVNQKTN